jgi:DNA polymerase-1
MLKTGRLASLEPNIMNIANKQEVAVQSVFKELGMSVPKLRSTFMAEPGKMMIVADYTQAELAALGYMSGDPALTKAIKAGDDIHSTITKQMFNLDCEVSQVKKLYPNLRVSGKSIVFGTLYGRGAPAIAREVRKSGVDVSDEEIKSNVDKFMTGFPGVADLIESSHKDVVDKGWVETLWGRRAFYPSVAGMENEKQALAAQQRKAFNFLIQGYVGDLLRAALVAFYQFMRSSPGVDLGIILTVHDSIMGEASFKDIEYVAEEVFPLCMTEKAVCPKLPFQIAIDVDVSDRWDEQLYFEDFVERGLSEEFAKKHCKKDDDGSILEKP